jgi:hypothetical protein
MIVSCIASLLYNSATALTKKFDRFLRVFEIFAAHFMNGIFVESILCAQKGGKRREQIRVLDGFSF